MSTTLAQRHDAAVVGGNVFDQLAQVARDPAVDAGKLSVIYELMKDYQAQQRKDETERARVAFFAALAEMQRELPVIRRDADNPNTKSRYARLETIWAKCCPVWTKWGFAVAFDTKMAGGLISTSLRLSHKSGHVEMFHAPDAPPDATGLRGVANKTGVQGNQSTVSYQKRGLLCSALGIVTAGEDDDGAGGAAPSSVVQRRGRDMPPVARDEPIGRTRQEVTYPPPDEEPDPLVEKSGTKWLKNLKGMLAEANSRAAVEKIGEHPSVDAARENFPPMIVEQIDEMFNDAMSRIVAAEFGEQDANPDSGESPEGNP